MGHLLGLVIQSGKYNWLQAGAGVLAIGVGVVLALDIHRSATRTHESQARRRFWITHPTWFLRAWGAFMALCGVMLLLQ